MILLILFIIYWFAAFTTQLGIFLVTKDEEDSKYLVVEALLLGWLYLPIEIGEVIGYILNKNKIIIKERELRLKYEKDS